MSTVVKPLIFIAGLALLFEPSVSRPVTLAPTPPTNHFPKLGRCYVTRIKAIEGRLAGDRASGESGSQVELRNGVVQVSYDTVAAIVRSRVGDKVTMCVVKLPAHCPPGDFRGVVYRTRNWRTKQNWTLPNSEHNCGGA